MLKNKWLIVVKKGFNDWSPENITLFWDWLSSNSYLKDSYFSKQVGSGIFHLVKKQKKLEGDFLDYGCGSGFLIEYFLKTDLNCYGCDTSEISVNMVNEKFKSIDRWKGAIKIEIFPIPFEKDKFDMIACIETFEHLTDEMLINLLKEFYRVLKPGGIIILTTPNKEDLDKGMIYCPFCNSEFHRMQHFQSFSSESLRNLFEQYHFKITYCKEINLQYYCKIDNLYLFFYKCYYLFNKNFFRRNSIEPHLCIIATKV